MTRRIALFVLLLIASWIVMVVTHECGHLLGGMAGGATCIEFDLAPWRLPYSLHQPDPQPLLTLWSGPLLGVLFPMAAASVIRKPLAWFIADFCLVANGAYLALAWLSGDPWLDTARLLAEGSPPVLIVVYCVFTLGIGYHRFRSDCVRLLSPAIDIQQSGQSDSPGSDHS